MTQKCIYSSSGRDYTALSMSPESAAVILGSTFRQSITKQTLFLLLWELFFFLTKSSPVSSGSGVNLSVVGLFVRRPFPVMRETDTSITALRHRAYRLFRITS